MTAMQAEGEHVRKTEEKHGLREPGEVVPIKHRLFDRGLKEQQRQAQMSVEQARALHFHPEAQLLEIIVEKYGELREELGK